MVRREHGHYVGGILEKLVTTSRTHYKHLIFGPSGLVATYDRRTDATEEKLYYTHDHLGSVDSITDQAGAVKVRLSYDAFGRRRNEAGWAGVVPSADWSAIANSLRHGYTEHEHLDNLGLIHMNGRVYDPIIGRFMSADPYIQAPGFTQSFNRYSYVWNNPLSFTDPSGFSSEGNHGSGIRQWIDRAGARLIDTFRGFDFARNDRRIDVPFVIAGTPAPPNTNPGDDPVPPPQDPIDEKVNVSTTGVPCDFMRCGARGFGPEEGVFLTDELFWRSVYESAIDELIMAPIQGARDTYAACSEGRIGRCAYGVIDTACEVGKLCDGVRSWVSIAKDARTAAKRTPGARPPNMSPAGAGRAGALNEAKRATGVPTSQQPSRILPNTDARGNPRPGRIYEYEVPAPGGGTRTVRIRDDAAGHAYPDNPTQNRGPHFNDEAGNHYDYPR